MLPTFVTVYERSVCPKLNESMPTYLSRNKDSRFMDLLMDLILCFVYSDMHKSNKVKNGQGLVESGQNFYYRNNIKCYKKLQADIYQNTVDPTNSSFPKKWLYEVLHKRKKVCPERCFQFNF